MRTCAKLGLPLEWMSNVPRFDADAIIIATPAHTHYALAKQALFEGRHVLIEKPMTMNVKEAEELVELALRKGVTGFVDHTHLYSPAFRELKAKTNGALTATFTAGGPCKTAPRWDWGSHGVAMGLDLGVPCELQISAQRSHVVFTVCSRDGVLVYDDPPTDPTPLEVLLTEFIGALGSPQIDGLKMGLNVARVLQ